MKLVCYFGGFARLGGCEVFVANLMAGLKQRGVERSLIYWETVPDEIPILAEMAADGVSLVRSGFRKGCKFYWPDWVMFARSRRVFESADVVLLAKLFTPRHHRALRRRADRTGGKLIFVTDYRPSEKNVPLEILETFDCIIVQSADFEADLRSIGFCGEVHIVPYLLRPNAPPIPPLLGQPNVVRIGYLGRLVPDKNLGYLFRSFARLRRLAPDRVFELHLFGDGRDRQSLEALSADLGTQQFVRFHGQKNGPAVIDSIDSCQCFALTSVTEGQCLAALEILSRGRPMVATPVGALPTILDDDRLGLIAPLEAVDQYADALFSLTDRILNRAIEAETVKSAFDTRFGYRESLDRYLSIFTNDRAAPISP